MKTLTDSMPITAMVFNARSLSSGIRVLSTSALVFELLDGTRPVVQDDCRPGLLHSLARRLAILIALALAVSVFLPPRFLK